MTQWALGPDSGELLLRTGVTGSASRMGHRLTIAMRSWRATVEWDGEVPTGVEMTVDLDSLEVLRGEGGMTPLSGAEKILIRSNALKTLRAKKFPQAAFRTTSIERSGSVVRLLGVLDLAGRSAEQTVEVEVSEDSLVGTASVRHSDVGVKQYSMLMGAMKVADEVGVSLAVTRPA